MRAARSARRGYHYHRGAYGDFYIDGSTATRIDVREEINKPLRKRESHAARRNREKALHRNYGYVAMMAIALIVSSVILFGYIRLQAENKALTETIAAKESRLNSLRLENDEEYSRILSSVDLEHVKEVATGELNMKYAEEGQIVEVQTRGDDYVRQYAKMP